MRTDTIPSLDIIQHNIANEEDAQNFMQSIMLDILGAIL